MRFIRDIISERAEAKALQTEAKPAPRTVSTEPEIEIEAHKTAETAPMPIVRPAAPRLVGHGTPDRTMTRLSEPWSLDDDDVFKRLLKEDGANGADAAPVEPDPSEADAENVFDEWDAPQDAGTDASDIESFLAGDSGQDAQPGPLPALEPEEPEASRVYNRTPAPSAEADSPEDGAASAREPSQWDAPAMAQSALPEPAEAAREPASVVAVPAPASGRSGRSAGRVKTRLLGFGTAEAAPHDPFSQPQPSAEPGKHQAPEVTFPVGWLVVISGPGRGASFALHSGVSQIGRGEDQAIRLDFGDTSISRSNHAAIAYDEEQDSFYLGHGGKANMVRLNDRPVLSTEDVSHGALIRIGETTLRFIAFCDGTFNWSQDGV